VGNDQGGPWGGPQEIEKTANAKVTRHLVKWKGSNYVEGTKEKSHQGNGCVEKTKAVRRKKAV